MSSEAPPSSVLHIRCGDDILGKLDDAGLPGRKLTWCHRICDGVLPTAEDDRPLRAVHDHDVVVLWFEHDLFDQAILVRLLAWCAAHWPAARDGRSLQMVTTDRFPGIERFIGLGQLSPAQLAGLYATARAPVTPAQIDLGTRAWQAWSARDVDALGRLVGETALPYLGAAIRRYLQEFPSPRTGLTWTHRVVLDVLADGPRNREALFQAVQDREAAPWRGDTMFYEVLETAPGIERRGALWWMTDQGRRLRASA